jgi:hypothetical protein
MLLVRHLEQIDSRHRTCDVHQRVDPTELRQRLTDDGFRSRGRHHIQIDRTAPFALTCSAASPSSAALRAARTTAEKS